MSDPQGKDENKGESKDKTRPRKNRSGEAARLLEVKVGVFVMVAIIVAMAAVLLLGQKKHLFENRVKLFVIFDDVQGLSEGAPVHLAGVAVGKVSRIAFDRKADKTTVRVDLVLSRSALDLIREDSIATIGAKGLLGDKVVDLAVGSTASPAMLPGGRIAAGQPADFNHIMGQASQILDRVQLVVTQAVAVLSAIADPAAIAHIRGIIASLHAILRSAETGPGLAHALFYDQGTARKFDDLVTSLDTIASDVDTGVKRIDRLLAATDGDGDQILNNVSKAARSVGAAASEVRDSKIVAQLDSASSDLAVLTRQLRDGQGTLGALLEDPTVYEQLVVILGGVARSKVLRALVRYVIHQDDPAAPRKTAVPITP
jgi:phospholipid/cholesterol/gamma-HCH transport system substrate-binding protein